MEKSRWTTTLSSIVILLTELGCLATMIYLIRLLNGSNQRHNQDLLSLITGRAYEPPAPTTTTSAASPTPTSPTPMDVLMTQFDGLPQEAQATAMREYQEYMEEQGMWREPDPRVPQVIPGEPMGIEWSETPSSTSSSPG